MESEFKELWRWGGSYSFDCIPSCASAWWWWWWWWCCWLYDGDGDDDSEEVPLQLIALSPGLPPTRLRWSAAAIILPSSMMVMMMGMYHRQWWLMIMMVMVEVVIVNAPIESKPGKLENHFWRNSRTPGLRFIAQALCSLSTQLDAEWKFRKWHFDPISTLVEAYPLYTNKAYTVRNEESKIGKCKQTMILVFKVWDLWLVKNRARPNPFAECFLHFSASLSAIPRIIQKFQ